MNPSPINLNPAEPPFNYEKAVEILLAAMEALVETNAALRKEIYELRNAK